MKDLQELINEKQGQILENKAYLKATDYKIIKKYEGYGIEEEIIRQREISRNSINQLELEIREIEEEIADAIANQEEVL